MAGRRQAGGWLTQARKGSFPNQHPHALCYHVYGIARVCLGEPGSPPWEAEREKEGQAVSFQGCDPDNVKLPIALLLTSIGQVLLSEPQPRLCLGGGGRREWILKDD